MKILIYGVGGIGGFIGSYLKKTNNEIFFISRGKTNNLLKKNGLKLQTVLGSCKYRKIDVLEQINVKSTFWFYTLKTRHTIKFFYNKVSSLSKFNQPLIQKVLLSI